MFTWETITIPLDLPPDAKPLEMVRIPAGTFMMGSSEDEIEALCDEVNTRWFETEGPQHHETISYPFYMGKYEVTQAQWETVMGKNRVLFPPFGTPDSPTTHFFGRPNNPVEHVSWGECQEFIQRLNESRYGVFSPSLNRRVYGTFRLPKEVEWEYACRAGTTTRLDAPLRN